MTDQPKPPLAARWVLLLAAIAVIGLFWAAVWIADLFGAEAGTTPDWVAAIATLAAFGAAVVAGWYAHRALRVEQDRDRVRDEVARSAQAAEVAAWGELGLFYEDAPQAFSLGAETRTLRPWDPVSLEVTVRNGSRLPVHNLWVQVYIAPKASRHPTWELVSDYYVGTVPPETDVEVDLLDCWEIVSYPKPVANPNSPTFGRLVKAMGKHGDAFREGQTGVANIGWSFRDLRGEYWVVTPSRPLRPGPRPAVTPLSGARRVE